MTSRRWNVLYAGRVGLAGCSTSVASLARRTTPPLDDAYRLRPEPRDVAWEGAPLRVLHEWRSNLCLARLRDVPGERFGCEPRDQGVPYCHGNAAWVSMRAARDFLPVVDGIVLVLDSDPRRFDACLEGAEHLARDLADAAREPAAVAVVFQLNKRDLRDAVPVSVLVDAFRWPGPHAHVESVAANDLGVADALRALLGLMPQAC